MTRKPKPYTDFFKDGASKYDGEVYYRLGDKIKAVDQGDGSIVIEGWASTKAVDRENEVITPDAFRSSIEEYMDNPILLFMHDWYGKPIGAIKNAQIKDEGLWVRAVILPTNEGKDIIMLIKEGILKSFSIGFRVRKYEVDEDTDILTVTDLELMEISVVNVPANPAALFSEAKSKNLTLTELSPRDRRVERKENSKMAEKDILQRLEATDSVLDETKTAIDELKGNQEEMTKRWKEATEKAADLRKGLITSDEFNTFIEKIGDDILDVRKAIEKAENAKKVSVERVAYKDVRSLLQGGDLNEKTRKLFQAPVDYDKTEGGYLLKELRDLNDAVLLNHYYFGTLRRKAGYHITQLKSYQAFLDRLNMIDPEYVKAMATGNTGYGAEVIPTAWSSEFTELMRIMPMLPNRFPYWNIPEGSSGTWPFQNGKASVYKGSEALVANADEIRKTRFATSNVTFTPDVFIGAIPVSKELTEDAIVDILGEVRRELGVALMEGLESALINGDDSATHQDNASATLYQSYDVETCFKGLRKLASSDSKTFSATSASVGDATSAFAMKDILYIKQLMGIAGLKNPRDVLYIAGVNTRFAILRLHITASEYGALSTLYTGNLPPIDGSDIYISEHCPENLNASGLYDNSTTDRAVMLAAHVPSFRIGQKRSVEMENDYNPLTQQLYFVASARWDFQKIVASTTYPVALAYNVRYSS